MVMVLITQSSESVWWEKDYQEALDKDADSKDSKHLRELGREKSPALQKTVM